MNFLEDLKKKGQTFVQNAGNAANKAANNLVQTVQNTGNAANNAVKNVYNTAVQGANNVKSAIDQGARNVQNAATGQPTNDDTAWVEEYNQFNAENSAPTTVPTAATTPTTESTTASTNANAGASASTTPQDVTQNPQWQAELDGIMNKILNREKFSYDMNGDAMYQQYADIYQNQANLGMENAMAQNAALTGGYGSSYGQMVGQQAYAQQMQGLNEIGMDLYDRAYQQYMNEGDQLAQQYSMLADREGELYNRDYQAGRDEVADNQWNAMNGAYEFDENGNIIGATGGLTLKLQDDTQAHDQGIHDSLYGYTDENGEHVDGYYDRDREDTQGHDLTMQGNDQKHDLTMQSNDQKHDLTMQGNELKQEDDELGFFYGAEFDENGNIIGKTGEGYYDEQAKTAAEANNPNTTYEGEGALNGQSVPKALAGVQGLTTTNTNLFDSNGNFMSAAVVSVDRVKVSDPSAEGYGQPHSDDVVTYNVGGKEVKLRRGYSPYTNSKNPDAANGTFNGFQPDNVGGNKLSDTGVETIVNGQWVPIYSTPDGKEWVYDAANNKYFEAEKEEENKPKNAGGFSGGGGGGSKVVQTQK